MTMHKKLRFKENLEVGGENRNETPCTASCPPRLSRAGAPRRVPSVPPSRARTGSAWGGQPENNVVAALHLSSLPLHRARSAVFAQ